MLHAATDRATLQKVEDCSTFPSTHLAIFRCERSYKEGVLHAQFLLNFLLKLNSQLSVFLCTGDPIEFLAWFLNSLHTTLGGTKKRTSSMLKNFGEKLK